MRKKRNQSAARDSRLFALLMVEEYRSRGVILHECGIGIDYGVLYAQFLRSQSNHSDALCPYRLATAMITGRA